MHIRPAVRGDYRRLERLWAEQSAHHVALHPTHVRPVSEYLSPEVFAEAIDGAEREIAVIDDEGDLLGAAILVERVMDGKYTVPRRVTHVHEIVVTGAARRRGLGRSLLEYIENWTRSRQLEAVELNVWANNEDAMAFYRALGFTPLRHEMHKRIE